MSAIQSYTTTRNIPSVLPEGRDTEGQGYMASRRGPQAPKFISAAEIDGKVNHCSDARLGHRQISHRDRPSIQEHHHEANKDHRGQQTNKGGHTQLSLIHAPGIHRGPPICIMDRERYTSRQPSTQESGVCTLAGRTTDNAAVSGNETLQSGEVCRKTAFLWQLPEMGTQSLAMRRENKVRILCRESRHKVVQGENRQWGENHTKVPKLLSTTQCLESQVSPAARLTPTCRQGSGDPSGGICTSYQRVPIPVPGDTPATLTPDPPPADASPYLTEHQWTSHNTGHPPPPLDSPPSLSSTTTKGTGSSTTWHPDSPSSPAICASGPRPPSSCYGEATSQPTNRCSQRRKCSIAEGGRGYTSRSEDTKERSNKHEEGDSGTKNHVCISAGHPNKTYIGYNSNKGSFVSDCGRHQGQQTNIPGQWNDNGGGHSPPPHRPQDSCFDLTLTAMVIDNKMMTEQPPLPPTITHRDQPVRLPIQTQAAALLTPVCPVTQLSQPATMHQANPITEPTSPLSQPLPAVKSKHHQPTRQSQAQ